MALRGDLWRGVVWRGVAGDRKGVLFNFDTGGLLCLWQTRGESGNLCMVAGGKFIEMAELGEQGGGGAASGSSGGFRGEGKPS